MALAIAQQIDGVVMAPLSNEAMHMAGLAFADEIAYLGSLADTQVRSVVTWNGIYRSSVTGHVALREVPDLVTRERIAAASNLTHQRQHRSTKQANLQSFP